MKEEEILEGNKLIAIFMGGTIQPPLNIWDFPEATKPPWALMHLSQFLYHHSYDWLIPVIKQINGLGYDVEINSNLRRINIFTTDKGSTWNVPVYDEEFRGNSSLYKDFTDIECAWTAVIWFIEWYNTKKC